MSDAKGPYKYSGGKFNGPNGFDFKVEWGDGLNLDTVALTKEISRVANIAYAAGRASRDGLREALKKIAMEDVHDFSTDDAIHGCSCLADFAKKALEADGEGE
jgi:hypothetical protein